MVPQWGPYGERCSIFRENGSFIPISQIPQLRSCSMKPGENILSLSTEPHADRRPRCNGVWSGSPRGSFMTLLLTTPLHAAFNTIALAWVDQSPISQHVW